MYTVAANNSDDILQETPLSGQLMLLASLLLSGGLVK